MADLREKFDAIERGICNGNLNAMQVFTKMRALLSQEAKPVAQPVAWALMHSGRLLQLFREPPMPMPSCDVRALYAAAPDEEAKHRIEAFEEAASICDAAAAQARSEKLKLSAHEYGAHCVMEGQISACVELARLVRALADRERG